MLATELARIRLLGPRSGGNGRLAVGVVGCAPPLFLRSPKSKLAAVGDLLCKDIDRSDMMSLRSFSTALAVTGRGNVFSNASRACGPVGEEEDTEPGLGNCIAFREPIPSQNHTLHHFM
jgi:hypothetical protein